MRKVTTRAGLFVSILTLFVVSTVTLSAQQAEPATVIDLWNQIPIPPASKLDSVSVDPATTALLVLDMQNNLVNRSVRPRASASIPRIGDLLSRARAAGMLVVYSNTNNATPADITPALAPSPGDPVVRSGVDKFYHTDLEKILTEHGIRTVIVTGTAANGAVLYTATGAALRGLKVVVPVDGMSAEPVYVEQYVAYHLLEQPGDAERDYTDSVGYDHDHAAVNSPTAIDNRSAHPQKTSDATLTSSALRLSRATR